MRAIKAQAPGGPEVLRQVDEAVPSPPAGEVLIRVRAAGVNRPDLRQRAGGYPPPPGVTDTLGLEVAGEIAEVGNGVTGLARGDQVCALVAGGGYADYCLAPHEQVLPKPASLSWLEAAAVPETYFTVWSNLFDRGQLAPGETVLIHGGASGIGTTAVQLARARGSRVITTVGTVAKADAVTALGADVVIDYRREDFVERTRAATDGTGVDVILDMVCASYLERNVTVLAPDGRLVVMAFLGGGRAEVDIEAMIRRRQTLCGTTLRPQTPAMKGRLAQALYREVWPLLEAGTVRPVIHQVNALVDANLAHAALEAGDHVGKFVLSLD